MDGLPYIDDLAWQIRHVVEPEPDPDGDPGYDLPLYRIYAVLCLAKGTATTLEDVHNAWSAWTADEEPEHRSLIPFNQLTERVQELDRPYMEAIHKVARESDGRERHPGNSHAEPKAPEPAEAPGVD